MKITYYVIWILGLSLAQTTVLDYARIMGVKPNLFLVFIVCVALISAKPWESSVVGFVLGFLLDFMTGKSMGLNMLLFMYVGVVAGLLFERLLTNKYFGIISIVFIASVIYSFLYYSMSFMMWGEGNFWYEFVRIMLPEAVYSTVICVPLYRLARRTYRYAK